MPCSLPVSFFTSGWMLAPFWSSSLMDGLTTWRIGWWKAQFFLELKVLAGYYRNSQMGLLLWVKKISKTCTPPLLKDCDSIHWFWNFNSEHEKSLNHYLMGYFFIVQFWEYFVCSEYKSIVRFVIYKYMLLVYKVFYIRWTMSSIQQKFLKFCWRPMKIFFFLG